MQRESFATNGPSVLGDDQRVAIGQLPDLLRPEDRYVVAVEAAAPAAAMEVVAAAGHPRRAEQVGDLLVELAVLAAAEDHDVVGQAEHRPRLVLAVADDELAPGLRGVDERQAERPLVGHPGAQGRQRRRRRQLVEAGQERRAKTSVRRRHRHAQRGVEDVLGDRRHQRRRGGVRVLPAQQVDRAAVGDDLLQIGGGPPGSGTQRRRIDSWKNSAIACWTVVIVLPAVRWSPWRRRAAVRPRTAPRPDACAGFPRAGSRCAGRRPTCSTSSRDAPASAAAWKYA